MRGDGLRPIELYIEVSLREVQGVHRVQFTRLSGPLTNSQIYSTTIRSYRPDLEIVLYWHHLPHNSIRLISRFRPELESYVKGIIAGSQALRLLVESQTGGDDWSL